MGRRNDVYRMYLANLVNPVATNHAWARTHLRAAGNTSLVLVNHEPLRARVPININE